MMAVYKACMSPKAVAVRMLLKQIAKVPKIGERRLAWEVIAVSIDDYFVEYDRAAHARVVSEQRKNPKSIYKMHNEHRKLLSAAEAHDKARKFFFESPVFEFWSYSLGLEPDYVRRVLKSVEVYEVCMELKPSKQRRKVRTEKAA